MMRLPADAGACFSEALGNWSQKIVSSSAGIGWLADVKVR